MFFSFNILELLAFLKMKTTLAQFALIGALLAQFLDLFGMLEQFHSLPLCQKTRFLSLRESQIGCVSGMLSVHADDLPKT